MRLALALALLAGCPREPAPVTTPAAPAGKYAPLAIRATERIAARCGPDSIARHPTSIADLDGDGAVERVAIVREPAGLAVRLIAVPSMHEVRHWQLQPANGYVEVATPRRRGSQRGDLWVQVGTSSGTPPVWSDTLYHLEGGALAPVATAGSAFRVAVDVDGDGRVDPIAPSPVEALLADGRRLAFPVVLPSRIHGVPLLDGREEAIDLDGNGVRELILERDDGIAIVEVPALREVWSVHGKPYHPHLVRWGGAWVLFVRLDDVLHAFATDASHAQIAAYPDAAVYADAIATFADRMVMSSIPPRFYDREHAGMPVAVLDQQVGLALRDDDPASPAGPVRLAPGDAPGLLLASRGSGRLELELVDPITREPRRAVWTGQPEDGLEDDTTVRLVDLDRDGRVEMLLDHQTLTFMHHGSSWRTSRLELRDGLGRLLWSERRARTESWSHEDNGRMRQTEWDGTHVRAFDLGDGTTALRVRSLRDEYYLLSAGSRIVAVPPCLE